MKKQLLIAATATTMSVSALADISITGAASATWTATDFNATSRPSENSYGHDMDITITGTSGATTVTTTLDLEDVDNATVGEIKMTTSLMGIDLTITDDKCSGTACTENNAAQENVEFIATTEIAGVTLTFEDSNVNANGSVEGSLDIAGATVTVKQAATATTTTVTGDFGGITGTYQNVSNDAVNADTSKIEVSGEALGSTLTVTTYQADSAAANWLDLDGDSAAVKESTEGTVIKLTTDLAGNSVTITSTDSSDNGVQTNGSAGEDKVVIAGTRALESGADLTATYTQDTLGAKNTVALKIAVSF